MVIVVLGGKEGYVDHPHRLFQARMEGGQGDQALVPGVQAGDESSSCVLYISKYNAYCLGLNDARLRSHEVIAVCNCKRLPVS
jgi:hypothetical protein